MAWRYRRSKSAGPFRLNISKSGIGWSFGVRGSRIGKDARGRTYTAASIPGTGLYSRTYSSSGKRRVAAHQQMLHVMSPEGKAYIAEIQQELNQLPESERDPCLLEVMGKLKRTSTAQLLWLVGSHYAYLDKWGVQIFYWATLGGFLLWALADIFRIPGMVIQYNRRIAPGLLREAIASRLNRERVSQSVPGVPMPVDNSGRRVAVNQEATSSPPESSPPRHGLYQAIAFAREHLPLGDIDEKDLNAIEQYFLWNETAVLITRASATSARNEVATADAELPAGSDISPVNNRSGPPPGFLVVTDQRLLYWSAPVLKPRSTGTLPQSKPERSRGIRCWRF